MNAQSKNAAERELFLNGGRLDSVLDGERQRLEDRQREEVAAHKIVMRGVREFGMIKECPCGCGLKNDICQAHASAVAAQNDKIPF